MRKIAVAVALVAALVPSLARAESEQHRLFVKYANDYYSLDESKTATIVIAQGDTILFTNLDPYYVYAGKVYDQLHDVQDDDPEYYLFSAALTKSFSTVGIDGVQKLAPGRYGFHCSRHSGMRGTLEVVAAT